MCTYSMADWYLKAAQEGESEQSRLARILDIAQDLKVGHPYQRGDNPQLPTQ